MGRNLDLSLLKKTGIATLLTAAENTAGRDRRNYVTFEDVVLAMLSCSHIVITALSELGVNVQELIEYVGSHRLPQDGSSIVGIPLEYTNSAQDLLMLAAAKAEELAQTLEAEHLLLVLLNFEHLAPREELSRRLGGTLESQGPRLIQAVANARALALYDISVGKQLLELLSQAGFSLSDIEALLAVAKTRPELVQRTLTTVIDLCTLTMDPSLLATVQGDLGALLPHSHRTIENLRLSSQGIAMLRSILL